MKNIFTYTLILGGFLLLVGCNLSDKKDTIKEKEALKYNQVSYDNDLNDQEGGKGSYEKYNGSLGAEFSGKTVLFFHADWCGKCRKAGKNFQTSQITSDLRILEVDYDDYEDLRSKYGVSMQHTFVQIDNNGNMIKKWTGSMNLEDLKAQL